MLYIGTILTDEGRDKPISGTKGQTAFLVYMFACLSQHRNGWQPPHNVFHVVYLNENFDFDFMWFDVVV